MSDDLHNTVARQMVADGVLAQVDESSVSDFVAGDGLRLLFFAGPPSGRREAHDVAVALRELLRDYAGMLSPAWVAPEAEGSLQGRFRASATPCLVLLLDGAVLEVIPRVRDWADYAALFRRYLGEPTALQTAGAAG